MRASIGDRRSRGRGVELAHIDMRDGDDFVCPNCSCEIMLKHHGDAARMPQMQMFRCCCGTEMEFEHPRTAEAQQAG